MHINPPHAPAATGWSPAARAAITAGGPVWLLGPDGIDHVAAVADAHAQTGVTIPEMAVHGLDSRSAGGAVAVIPVQGPIMHRASWFGTSVGVVRTMLREALADTSVGSIVLHVDSPGGSVFGLPELADEIRSARDIKPIVAVADAYAASAGYFLASQATEVMVAPSGQVGSIGVLVMHTEFSAMDERIGITTTFVHAGKHKVEGNPYEPLSDAARAKIQADVDAYYAMFVDAVAAGRGVDVDTVASDAFGQGRMLLADDAVAVGMADAVGNLEAAISRAAELASGTRTGPGADAPAPEPAVHQIPVDAIAASRSVRRALAEVAATTTRAKETSQ